VRRRKRLRSLTEGAKARQCEREWKPQGERMKLLREGGSKIRKWKAGAAVTTRDWMSTTELVPQFEKHAAPCRQEAAVKEGRTA
jgi:hypothetical protein